MYGIVLVVYRAPGRRLHIDQDILNNEPDIVTGWSYCLFGDVDKYVPCVKWGIEIFSNQK